MLNAVRWCVSAERDATTDELHVTPQVLAQGLREIDPQQSLNTAALDRVFSILVSEGVTSSSSRPSTASSPRWTFNVDSQVRRFRQVRTVDELARATARPAAPNLFLGVPPTQLRIGSAISGSLSKTRVFVLMPFGPAWSGKVYEAITQGCFEAAGSAAVVERADEITETGSITQQIQDRIRQADILIADLTATNGNVMYELGYADALGKTVIPVNQDVAASPFDVSVHRQIPYVLHDLPALSQDVKAFVATALERRA
ncbi:nucleoside 2-deoxyribosyltransferase [Baekduia sp. Peel2402]|uniref:nucleoside 2-deoxyribosyltransferase n=1 Tax=Baekduia sp. Peel2402 TaxID=3458296 RepID=UPI00403EC0BF